MQLQLLTRTLQLLLVNAVIIPIYLLLRVYQDLPDKVVSHYNTNMVADDTMGKLSFTITMIAMTVLLGFGTGFGSGFLIRRYPSLLNIPNKEYWLADERRETTLASINRHMLQIGIATSLLFACIIQASINSTLHGSDANNTPLWIGTGVIGIYTTAVVLALCFRFKGHANQSSSEGAANGS